VFCRPKGLSASGTGLLPEKAFFSLELVEIPKIKPFPRVSCSYRANFRTYCFLFFSKIRLIKHLLFFPLVRDIFFQMTPKVVKLFMEVLKEGLPSFSLRGRASSFPTETPLPRGRFLLSRESLFFPSCECRSRAFSSEV